MNGVCEPYSGLECLQYPIEGVLLVESGNLMQVQELLHSRSVVVTLRLQGLVVLARGAVQQLDLGHLVLEAVDRGLVALAKVAELTQVHLLLALDGIE